MWKVFSVPSTSVTITVKGTPAIGAEVVSAGVVVVSAGAEVQAHSVRIMAAASSRESSFFMFISPNKHSSSRPDTQLIKRGLFRATD